MMKRTWIWGVVAAIGLATSACGGGKATCEKVIKRAMECSPDMAKQSEGMKKMATDMADQMIGPLCEEDEAQSEAKKAASCLDETSCDAFNACAEKAGLDMKK